MQTTTAPSTSQKDRAAHLLAERLRERYGKHLWKIFRIPDNPYEAQHFEPGVYAVAVFEEEVDPFQQVDDLHRITDALNAELAYDVITTAYATSRRAYDREQGYVACSARRANQPL